MGLFDDIIGTVFNPGRGHEAAEKQNRAGWEEAKGFLKPYAERGGEVYPGMLEAFKSLLDPQGLQNKWAESYQQSPMAKRMLEMNTGRGMEDASRMGLMGSSAALSNIQQGAGDIVSRDRQQYMEDLMKKYLAGLGLGEGIYGQGANAAGNLAGGAQRFGEGMAGLEYGRKMAPWNLYNNFMSQVGQGLGGMFGMR